jgi:hypothetical protein
LIAVDRGLARKAKENGIQSLTSEICSSCIQEIQSQASQGSVLIAREKAREQKKMALWKSRVALIKRARQLMAEKMFSDAAVTYEKYLKILEIVFDVKSGGLTPEHFKDSARTQELTVMTTVYWDLMRIYDTSEKYGDRMKKAADKLALFLSYTPIYPDIIKKAQSFQKTAKNQAVVKSFLKRVSEGRGRCFIATVAFDSGLASEVVALRRFRDRSLMTSSLGRGLVRSYYFISPPLAAILSKSPLLKAVTRRVLRFLVNLLPRNS